MELAKKDIRALSKEALQDFFIAQGQQAYRAAQVYQWLWSKGVHDFDKMTNLSKDTRLLLDTHFTINHIAAVFLPVLLGDLWIVSPAGVFVLAAGMAMTSLALAMLIPRHPVPGHETVFSSRAHAPAE